MGMSVVRKCSWKDSSWRVLFVGKIFLCEKEPRKVGKTVVSCKDFGVNEKM